jgi:hypothetical protein
MSINYIVIQSLKKGAHVVVEIYENLREVMEEAHLKLTQLFTRFYEVIE